MGFYYNSSEPPKQEKEPGGCLEALIITRAVFGVLALPLAMILGLFVVLAIMILAFSIAWYLGILWVLLIGAGTAVYARWERGHFGGGAH
jgi:hypothetical protein